MALPRIIAMTCIRKEPFYADFILVFEVKTTEDVGKGGYLKAIVDSSVAADFAIGTEYTWTATAGD